MIIRSFLLFSLVLVAACGSPKSNTAADNPCAAAHSGHWEQGHDATMHKRFTDPVEMEKSWNGMDRDEWQNPTVVLQLAGIQGGHTVADIGAGTGYFVPYLAASVGSEGTVLALDIEQSMVDHIEAKKARFGWPNVLVKKVAPDSPGLAIGSVDRVLIVNTWHHIDDREAYAAKLFASLKPGGVVTIIDWGPQATIGPKAEHRLDIALASLPLEKAGFQVGGDETRLKHQYAVIATKPTLGGSPVNSATKPPTE